MNCRDNRREGHSMMLCFRRKTLVFLLINVVCWNPVIWYNSLRMEECLPGDHNKTKINLLC